MSTVQQQALYDSLARIKSYSDTQKQRTTQNSSSNGSSQYIDYRNRPGAYNPAPQPQGSSSSFSGWGLGALAVVGIGLAAWALTGGRVKTSQVSQLAEHIHFKPAKTMDEAVTFAKKNLGVKLKLDNDLYAANFVNEQLVTVSNKMKGKLAMPKVVQYQNTKSADNIEGFASWNNRTKTLSLSENCREGLHQSQIAGGVDNFDKDFAIYCQKNGIKSKHASLGLKGSFIHELGHAQHYANCPDAGKMGRIAELRARKIEDTHYTEEFLEEVEKSAVIKNLLPEYELTSGAEYAAGIFRAKIQGITIPPEAERLYEKVGGMPLAA